MKFLLSFIMLSIVVSQAYAGTSFPALRSGQCYSNPDSKNYLAGLKSGSNYYNSIVSDVGANRFEKLSDNSEVHNYFCQITCMGQDSQLMTKWVLHQDNPAHFSDMNGFVCHGVGIENVQIVGSIYGPQPVVTSFWAFETDYPELRSWLKATKFRLSPRESEARWTELSKAFVTIGVAYYNTQTPMFVESGRQILEISARTPEGKSLAKTYISILTKQDWSFDNKQSSVQGLVFMNLKAMGRFLEYE